MRLTSTINPSTRLEEDVPVLVVALDGKRKFVSRPKTYKDLQRLIRLRFALPEQAVLALHVSTLDVCAGNDVEFTEEEYPLLAPVLDVISVSVAVDGSIPTPDATPPLSEEEEDGAGNVTVHQEPEAEQNDEEDNAEVAEMIINRVKQESDDEEVFAGSRFGGGSDTEEERAEARRRVGEALFPEEKPVHVKKEKAETKPLRLQERSAKKAPKVEEEVPVVTPKARSHKTHRSASPTKSHGANLTRVDTTASERSETNNDPDRFKLKITLSIAGRDRDCNTRAGHKIGKILDKVAENLDVNTKGARIYRLEYDSEQENYRKIQCGRDQTLREIRAWDGMRFEIKLYDEPDSEDDEEED
ncbi:Zn(2)-C6 fungal-type domain-containing protein [Mycena chlorophos]|uniref:Zn(2)-C6 fungal-type domain-containing protein n=1 Tax=Mycena chlorophos TaxID=658473 RepID=A0A8H6TUL1_MYCCL|nr:Zn(2)-C6 fungal-type domain-containing protein [Mycena chlorophos]